jgi:hypothetical protein
VYTFLRIASILLLTNVALSADVYIVAGQSNGWRLSHLAGVPGEAASPIYYFGMDCSSRPDTARLTEIKALHPSVSGTGLAEALRKHSGKEIVFHPILRLRDEPRRRVQLVSRRRSAERKSQ